jgi:hypothetical protein
MLASTVQFSNNDQPPITPNQPVRVHWGRHEGPGLPAVPSDTQQRARPDLSILHVPRRSSTSEDNLSRRIVNVPPMSEPPPDICRRNGL